MLFSVYDVNVCDASSLDGTMPLFNIHTAAVHADVIHKEAVCMTSACTTAAFIVIDIACRRLLRFLRSPNFQLDGHTGPWDYQIDSLLTLTDLY